MVYYELCHKEIDWGKTMKQILTALVAVVLGMSVIISSVFASSDHQRPDNKIIQPVQCEYPKIHECNVHKYCSWDPEHKRCKRVCASYKTQKSCENNKTCSWMSDKVGDAYCFDHGKLGSAL